MDRLLAKFGIAAAIGGLFCANPIVAQIIAAAPKATHVEITKGPELEIARDDFAIIRWTTNNPGGDDDHFAVMHYGTALNELTQTAENHILRDRNEGLHRVFAGPPIALDLPTEPAK